MRKLYACEAYECEIGPFAIPIQMIARKKKERKITLINSMLFIIASQKRTVPIKNRSYFF